MRKFLIVLVLLSGCTGDGPERDPHEWVHEPGIVRAIACVELDGEQSSGTCRASSPWGTEHVCPEYMWEGDRGCCVEGPGAEGESVAIYWLPCTDDNGTPTPNDD